MVDFHRKYGYLTETNIQDFLTDNLESINQAEEDAADVLVFGNHGKVIKARTVINVSWFGTLCR
jgi:hypothetical protein